MAKKKTIIDVIDKILDDMDYNATELEKVKIEIQEMREKIDELNLFNNDVLAENKLLKKQKR